MPILTARTQAQGTPVVPVEAIQPRDRLLAPALAISGPRAEAILKILETLGRHLNGSEVLPKEALAKLMETLARILKFPPLPQETSHDFGRRLASFLEKLPPEARAVLEKQLGQRNLALQVRLLVEVLQSPAGTDAGRLRATLQNQAYLTSPSRDTGQQVRSSSQPALPAQHLATLTARSAPGMFAAPVDAALLQAVLRKTFGSDAPFDVSQPALGESELDAETVAVPKRPGESNNKTGQAQQAANATAARAATPEPIPQLRAAAAFLAADPEALSLVSAIAQGEIDPQVETAFASQPDDKTPPGRTNKAGDFETDGTFVAEPDMEAQIDMVELQNATDAAEPSVSTPDSFETPLAEPVEADQQALPQGDTEQAQDARGTEQTPFKAGADRVVDAPLDDRSVTYEAPEEHQPRQEQEEKQAATTDRPSEKPVRILAETLKALVQNTLPLPEGTTAETAAYRQTALGAAGGTVPSVASVTLPGLEAMLDAATTASDKGWTAELSDEIDSWMTQVEAGAEEVAEEGWRPLPKADEAIRDPLLQHRLLEAMVGRDAVPFAIIPYLPAKPDDDLFAEAAEEHQASTEEEESGGETQDEDQPNRRDDEEPMSLAEQDGPASEDEDTTQDAYALYMRMGGLA
ncbi:hypothetical protein P6U16_10600 [Rhizobium sp. 32-5/1]|uniref:hypothetical protein n=1 Tax=Rhizobium sp. 32-5/1 TaxID=3019602 RepID=UPI00240DC76B|nr:hypothetical protein [Rhizobium sp. 32-5/1]WEZ84927.1 hypothetical protein P6U16_10600 [Rhizobium sp. 32-5/1]